MTYCSLDTLKSALHITNTNEDTLLTTFLNSAQQVIDGFCKRTFEAAADTIRYFDAIRDLAEDNSRRLILYDQRPNIFDLCQITSVLNGDGATLTSADYVTVPPNSTPFWALDIKRFSTKVWTYSTNPEKAIQITGRWAYSLTAPADIVIAHMRLAMWFYRQKDTSADITYTIQSSSGPIIIPADLPRDVKAYLQPYVRERL